METGTAFLTEDGDKIRIDRDGKTSLNNKQLSNDEFVFYPEYMTNYETFNVKKVVKKPDIGHVLILFSADSQSKIVKKITP